MFKKESFSFTLTSVLIVNLLAAAGDVTLTWTSPVYPKLYSNDSSINPLGRPITEDEDGWLGSLVTLGAMVGPLPFTYIAGLWGRKVGLLCIAIPHIVSYLILAFGKNIYLFYFARIFGGLALGGGYSLLPMYIAEISRDSNRGMMSLTLNIFWAVGNLLSYAIGPFVSIMAFNCILASIPAVFFVIFLLVGVETPYYLVEKDKIDKAEKSLIKLRSLSKEGVEKELEDMKNHMKEEDDGHFYDIIKKKELRKAFIISVILISSQEACGSSAIQFYLQPIFDTTGADLSSDISALIVGVALFISSFISPFIVDKVGRRLLIVSSCFGTFISLMALGTFFYIQDSTIYTTDNIMWLPILSLIFFIISYNIGMGCIPWTLCSELFPNNVKKTAASLATSICWAVSFLITRFFNEMNDFMGQAGTFWFYAAICLLTAIFSIVFMPETKGKSFSEIQHMLKYGNVKEGISDNHNPEKTIDTKLPRGIS